MLVVRSPHHHARFAFGDLDAFVAEHPGVVAVFTAADIPGRNCFGVIPPFADQPALAEGVARFRGEAVALIAGEREAIADLDLARFPGRHGPRCRMLLRPVRGAAEGALPASTTAAPGNLLTSGFVERGDPEAALAAAAHAVSGRDRDVLCRARLYRAGGRLCA